MILFYLDAAVETAPKHGHRGAGSVARTNYVISAIMAVLIVAFITIIVYLKIQQRKTALADSDHASSGSISKSTQSTLQQQNFDLKQSVSEMKSCVFHQVSQQFPRFESSPRFWSYFVLFSRFSYSLCSLSLVEIPIILRSV